jgi:hypothetical protein
MLWLFKYYHRKIVKNWRFLLNTLLLYAKKLIITLVFSKTPIFNTSLLKIAENSDRNIEPWFAFSFRFRIRAFWRALKQK